MPVDRLQPTRAWACRALLCLLGLGLLLQGQTELQRRVLGAAHVHAVRAAPALEVDHLDHHAGNASVAHAHHHGHSLRHHHGPGDATVVALKPLHAADGHPAEASLGSVLQPLAMGGSLGWCPAACATHRWPPAPAQPWRNASLRQPERPPSA